LVFGGVGLVAWLVVVALAARNGGDAAEGKYHQQRKYLVDLSHNRNCFFKKNKGTGAPPPCIEKCSVKQK
jgi:hypothetical protein